MQHTTRRMPLNNSSILIHVPNQEGGKPLIKTRNNIIKHIFIIWLKTGLWREGSIGLHDDVITLKHFPRYWPFVRGIHRPPVNSPHKGQWLGPFMFSSICAWINGWVNNREAGDLRRHRAHYDVTWWDTDVAPARRQAVVAINDDTVPPRKYASLGQTRKNYVSRSMDMLNPRHQIISWPQFVFNQHLTNKCVLLSFLYDDYGKNKWIISIH